MRQVLLGLVVCGGFLSPVGALAEPARPQEDGAAAPARALRGDRDGDRLLSVEEFVADAARRFDRLDKNGDGVVERSEVQAAADDIARRIRARMEKSFERADQDDDGRLTKAEAESAATKRFARLDRDADGKLKAEDLRWHSRRGDASKPADLSRPADASPQ
jgi:EF hand domain-containing protein